MAMFVQLAVKKGRRQKVRALDIFAAYFGGGLIVKGPVLIFRQAQKIYAGGVRACIKIFQPPAHNLYHG